MMMASVTNVRRRAMSATPTADATKARPVDCAPDLRRARLEAEAGRPKPFGLKASL